MLMIIICTILSIIATLYTTRSGEIVNSLVDSWKVVLILIVFYLVFVALTFIGIFVISLFVDKEKEVEKPSKFFTYVYHYVNDYIMRLFRIHIVVNGIEKLDKNTDYLFVCNHRSNLDPMILGHIQKHRKFVMVSKPENFNIPIAGAVVHEMGYLSLNRSDVREAVKTIDKASAYLQEGYNMVIYPEGTRNKKDINILPFRNGAFKIAKKGKAPIAVLCMNGTEKISKNLLFGKSTVYVDVLYVVSKEEVEEMKTVELGERIAKDMQKCVEERNIEIDTIIKVS